MFRATVFSLVMAVLLLGSSPVEAAHRDCAEYPVDFVKQVYLDGMVVADFEKAKAAVGGRLDRGRHVVRVVMWKPGDYQVDSMISGNSQYAMTTHRWSDSDRGVIFLPAFGEGIHVWELGFINIYGEGCYLRFEVDVVAPYAGPQV